MPGLPLSYFVIHLLPILSFSRFITIIIMRELLIFIIDEMTKRKLALIDILFLYRISYRG